MPLQSSAYMVDVDVKTTPLSTGSTILNSSILESEVKEGPAGRSHCCFGRAVETNTRQL